MLEKNLWLGATTLIPSIRVELRKPIRQLALSLRGLKL
jgi:hypothetical protein